MRRLDNIDLRLLRVFVALADANGFSDAQIALNLSQSTLSTHLSELEKRIGGQLCLRGGSRLPADRARPGHLRRRRQAVPRHRRLSPARRVRRVAICRPAEDRDASDGVITSPQLGMQKVIAEFMQPDCDIFIDLCSGRPRSSSRQLRMAIATSSSARFPRRLRASSIGILPASPTISTAARSTRCSPGRTMRSTSAVIAGARFSVRGYRHFDDLYRVGHPRASASIVDMEAQLMLILSGQFIGFLPVPLRRALGGARRTARHRRGPFGFSSMHKIAYRRDNKNSPLIAEFLSILERLKSSG